MTLGENLQTLRKAAGLSQDEVAGKLFVSRQSVSKWETDKAEPGVENLKALAKLYGVTVDALVGAEEPAAVEKLDAHSSDAAYKKLLKLRLLVQAAVMLGMAFSETRHYEFKLISECLAPGAAFMLLGCWVRSYLSWTALMFGETFAVLFAVIFFGSMSLMLFPLALAAGGLWLYRLCQRDIQQLFFKEDEVP